MSKVHRLQDGGNLTGMAVTQFYQRFVEYMSEFPPKYTLRPIGEDKFDMNYPILQEVNYIGSISSEMFFDQAGNRRYYPDTININENRYIVCNDWYYGVTRDTRSAFARWCFSGKIMMPVIS